MNQEKPLYTPCLAAHSPQRLERIVADKIAKILVVNSVPPEVKGFSENTKYDLLNCSELDNVILGISPNEECHSLLKESLKAMKTWWEKPQWFGGFGAPLRKLVQDCVSCLLDHIDDYSHYPLFRFTCQLCFTREAGVFYQNLTEIIVQLPKRHCDHYTAFLKHLGPFQIERLFNTCMIFGNTKPLVTLLWNAPFLRSLHLRYNSGECTLSHVGRACSNLETFIVEGFFGSLCVSERTLYRTFFCGLRKEEILAKGRHFSPPLKLSFPKLTRLDLGKSRMVHEFLSVLSSFYPGLKSLSCNSVNLVAISLLKASTNLDKVVPFRVHDLCLTCECLFHLSEETLCRYFPEVRHITLSFYTFPSTHLDVIKEKCWKFVTLCGVSSLTVHVPLEGSQDSILRDVLTPLFAAVGGRVKRLQFYLMQEVDASLVWSMVNACPRLELLGLCLAMEGALERGRLAGPAVQLQPLPHLTTLSASVDRVEGAVHFLAVTEEVIVCAPYITNLELLSPSVGGSWVIKLVARELLKGVSTLVLGLGTGESPNLDLNLDVDFYVVLLEGLTALRTLVLIRVPPVITGHLKRIFFTTQLEIVPGRKQTYLAYHGHFAKYGL